MPAGRATALHCESDAHGHDDVAVAVGFVGEGAHLAGGLFVFELDADGAIGGGAYWTDGWDGYAPARNRLLGTVAPFDVRLEYGAVVVHTARRVFGVATARLHQLCPLEQAEHVVAANPSIGKSAAARSSV